jgi:N-acetylneuraminic acid mutarotase
VWQAKSPYPLPARKTNRAVQIDGKIYVSGGESRRLDEDGGFYRVEPLSRLYVYDPKTNRWARRRDMPRVTSLGVSSAFGGRLYVATACHAKQFCYDDVLDGGALWRYTPSTDRWALLGRTPHQPHAGGFISGRFYLVDHNGAVDIYDPATDTWSVGPTAPTSCRTPASTTWRAKLYVVGCFNESGAVLMLMFDPEAGSWSEAAAPPVEPPKVEEWGRRWVLNGLFRNGKPRLELVGGGRSENNWQHIP